ALATRISDEVNDGKLSSDLTGFDDLGAAKDVAIKGSQVSLSTSHGASIILIYTPTLRKFGNARLPIAVEAILLHP
ncbi:MAG TPA: hypothetical protein VGD41_03335, partial [Pyrinomonadaceae bacterium]